MASPKGNRTLTSFKVGGTSTTNGHRPRSGKDNAENAFLGFPFRSQPFKQA
jgi:hypothetical protein